jgi:hypothetical protein
MILKKYRMIVDNGYIETLDEEEAIQFGKHEIVFEEIPDEVTEDFNG